MDFIRKILFFLLGNKLYFKTISKSFILLYRAGLLSGIKKFETHYFVKSLIRTGDLIIDIGANFGYYTSIFARAAGENGRIYAVEPVPLYRELLMSNTRKFNNIEYLPFALSKADGRSEMVVPGSKKYRHGLTRLSDGHDRSENNIIEVELKEASGAFSHLDAIDYLKCDIEGHEGVVIPLLKNMLQKYLPIVQIEIEKSNFDNLDTLFTSLKYKAYFVDGKKLREYSEGKMYYSDLIYIPEHRIIELTNNKLIY